MKIKWRKLQYVYRHSIDKNLYHLKLETGRNVKLTGNHSIFVLRNEGVKSELTSNIKELKVKNIATGIKFALIAMFGWGVLFILIDILVEKLGYLMGYLSR